MCMIFNTATPPQKQIPSELLLEGKQPERDVAACALALEVAVTAPAWRD